jgi:MATE family multidrug resistance protein
MNGTLFVIMIATPVNILLQIAFIFWLGLGYRGAAIATAITYTSLPILLIIYIVYFSNSNAWGGFDLKEALNIRLLAQFMRLGVPGVLQICSEWWCFEIVGLAAGIFGETQLAAQSILINTFGFAYMIPLGMSIASSTKVGNAIGANQPVLAKQSGIASLIVGSVISLMLVITFISIKVSCFSN